MLRGHNLQPLRHDLHLLSSRAVARNDWLLTPTAVLQVGFQYFEAFLETMKQDRGWNFSFLQVSLPHLLS